MGREAGIGKRLLPVVVACAMAACADLGGMRDFASLSASITGSRDLRAIATALASQQQTVASVKGA